MDGAFISLNCIVEQGKDIFGLHCRIFYSMLLQVCMAGPSDSRMKIKRAALTRCFCLFGFMAEKIALDDGRQMLAL